MRSRWSRAAVAGLALAGALGAVALSDHHDRRFDLTADGRNTLAAMTREVLAGLDRDVEAIAFLRRDGSEFAEVADLLDRFSRETPRFRARFADADGQPLLARQYGALSNRTIVLAAGKRRETLYRLDEATITNTLVRLFRDEERSVRFVQGHRERSIRDASPDGISRLGEALRATGIATAEVFLQQETDRTESDELVVVAGPRQDLFPAEIDWLDHHLDGGGRLLVLADPAGTPLLAELLARRGVRLGGDVVVDPQTRLFGADVTVPVVTRYGRHPVTDPLAGAAVVPTFFPLAQSVTRSPDAPPEVRIEVLASAGTHAWGERNLDGLGAGQSPTRDADEIRGPFPLAVAASREGSAAAIIVVGDSDFAANGNLDLSGNRDFALNAVAWLLRDEEQILLRTPRREVRPLLLSESDRRRVVWLPAFGLPALTAGLGLVVGFAGRRR